MNRGPRPMRRPGDRKLSAIVAGCLAALRLLSTAERWRAARLVAASVGHGFLDMIAIAAVLPLVALIVDPTVLQRHSGLGRPVAAAEAVLGGALIPSGAAACIALLTSAALLGLWLQRAINRFAADVQQRLAHEMFALGLEVPYTWFAERNAAMLTRLFHNDIVIVSRDNILRVINLARDVALVLFAIALVMAVAPGTGLIAMVAVVGTAATALRLIGPKLDRWARIKRQAEDGTVAMAAQFIGGIKDIKLSPQASHFVDLFDRAYRLQTDGQAALLTWNAVPSAVLILLGQVALLGVTVALWLAGVGSGEIAATLALLTLVTGRLLPAAIRITSAIAALANTLPWLQGLIETRDSLGAAARSTPGARAEPPHGWRRLVLRGVAFAYPGAPRPALADVTLAIEKGKAYGIVGPSGAGKTTLVDILLGLLSPTGGDVLFDDTPIAPAAPLDWRRRAGYVSQSPYVADASLRENVAFGVPAREIDDGRVAECLRLANLAEFVATLPHGLDTMVGDRGARLSGGQRQRVAIARALYHEPDLLVLDEATSALDVIAESAVKDAIERLRQRITTITVAHRLSTVRDCDRIFVLDAGRLVAAGSWDELVAGSPLFHEMVRAASGKEAA